MVKSFLFCRWRSFRAEDMLQMLGFQHATRWWRSFSAFFFYRASHYFYICHMLLESVYDAFQVGYCQLCSVWPHTVADQSFDLLKIRLRPCCLGHGWMHGDRGHQYQQIQGLLWYFTWTHVMVVLEQGKARQTDREQQLLLSCKKDNFFWVFFIHCRHHKPVSIKAPQGPLEQFCRWNSFAVGTFLKNVASACLSENCFYIHVDNGFISQNFYPPFKKKS